MTTQNKFGQSLFETVIALAVVAVIAVSLLALSTQSVSNSTESKNRSQAKFYAQEFHDWLRSKRDKDYDNFLTVSDTTGMTYCPNFLPPGITQMPDHPCDADDPGDYILPDKQFYREVTLTRNSDGSEVQADVRVGWKSGGGTIFIESTNILGDPRLF